MHKIHRKYLVACCVALVVAIIYTSVAFGGASLDYGQLPGVPAKANYVTWMSNAGTPPSEVLTEDSFNSSMGVDQGYQIGYWALNASLLMNPPAADAAQMYLIFGGLEANTGTIWTYDFEYDSEVGVTNHGTVGAAASGSCPAILPGSWNGTQKTINWAAPAGTYLIYRSVNASGASNGASNGRYIHIATVTTTGSTGSYIDPIAIESWHIVIPATAGGIINGCHSEESTPTAVTLVRFEAFPESSQVRVQWETATELDNLGFNLYRGESATGPWVKLNSTIIPAQQPGLITGAVYEWLDEAVPLDTTVFYRLEDVDIHGVSTFHGPVSAFNSGATAVKIIAVKPQSSSLPVALLLLCSATLLVWPLLRRQER